MKVKVTIIAAVLGSILFAEVQHPKDNTDAVLEQFEHLIHITEAWAYRPTFNQ